MRVILLIGILLANSLYIGCSDNKPTPPDPGTTRIFDIDGGYNHGYGVHTHICTEEEAQKLCIGFGYEDVISRKCANYGEGPRIYQVTCWKR